MRRLFISVGFAALLAAPVCAQVDPAQAAGPGVADAGQTEPSYVHPEDRMRTPPPVTGQTFPTELGSRERANYLRYGVVFTPAYSDNVLGGSAGHPVSDMSYSVAPIVAIDESTSRTHWVASYAPGFTFYQRLSARNQADQNASLTFSYRLTPHVTFSAEDVFQKSSNVFNQPNFGFAGLVGGGAEVPNSSVIAPVASQVSNFGTAGLTYQFALNEMVGVNGTFTNLHYPDPSQVPGLFDSASQAGSAFYSLRISKSHYVGAGYQYQRLVSYPGAGLNETQTQAMLAFYTLSPSSHFSLSFFGGPQYSDTVQAPVQSLNLVPAEEKEWNPAAGVSMNWQARLTSLALSYSHVIAGGGGLVGAVHMDNGMVSLRQQVSRTLSAAVSGGYTQNEIVGNLVTLANNNGHSISGTASLHQQIGPYLSAEVGYTRLHQSYTGIPVISTFPNTNREYISISYQFSRSLGR